MDIRFCQPDELERLVALLDNEFIFGKGRAISLRLRFPTVFCPNNLQNIIVCKDGDEIVSALAMRQFDWREGGEYFRGAMIGMVYTHPARRGNGLASRLLKAAASRLHEGGVDFGVLWSRRQSFYSRLGWVADDFGVLGEVELKDIIAGSPGNVTLPALEAGSSLLEEIRRSRLNMITLRRTEDYRQLPLPAESVDVLWCENRGRVAYALFGSSGETGFLYELVGEVSFFPALWQKGCCGRKRIFINDRINSYSCSWLADHTAVSWENQNLAMWLPLSKRVGMSRMAQWYIPYFDRI